MEIDVEIERISNGFIVTGNDSSGTKEYFSSIEKFIECRVIDPVKEIDKYYREHATQGEKQRLKLTIEEV